MLRNLVTGHSLLVELSKEEVMITTPRYIGFIVTTRTTYTAYRTEDALASLLFITARAFFNKQERRRFHLSVSHFPKRIPKDMLVFCSEVINMRYETAPSFHGLDLHNDKKSYQNELDELSSFLSTHI